MHRLNARMHALRDIGYAVTGVRAQEFVVKQLGQILRRCIAGAENGVDSVVQRRVHARRIGVEQLIELRIGRDFTALEQVKG
jgi:hypothetical protein